jgi:hypothetical protein
LLGLPARIASKTSCADFACCLSQASLEALKGTLARDQDGFSFREAVDTVSKGFLPEVINFFSELLTTTFASNELNNSRHANPQEPKPNGL